MLYIHAYIDRYVFDIFCPIGDMFITLQLKMIWLERINIGIAAVGKNYQPALVITPISGSNQQVQKKGKRFFNFRRNSMRMPKKVHQNIIFSQMVGKPWMVVIFISWDPFLPKKNRQTKKSKGFLVGWWCWIPFGKIRKITHQKKTNLSFWRTSWESKKRTSRKSTKHQTRRGWFFARMIHGSFNVRLKDLEKAKWTPICVGIAMQVSSSHTQNSQFNRWRFQGMRAYQPPVPPLMNSS